MRRVISTAVVVWAAALLAAAAGQARPDFTGKWTFVPGKSVTQARGANAVRSAPPFGAEFTARQDAASLTIQTAQTPSGTTYKFDGSELKSGRAAAPGQPEVQAVSRAAWDGKSLVITTTSTMSLAGQSHTTKSIKTLSLASDGTLVVETSGTLDGVAAPVLRSVYAKS